MLSHRRLPHHWRIGVAGIMAIGVTFGFARYGYGLFLPEIRREFGLSVPLVGVVASATYLGYLLALTLVGTLAARLGPRALIVTGGLAATAGMAMVAFAGSTPLLVIGLILAGTSSGWAWAPYSDAVDQSLPAERRERVLALLPSGTAFATAIAGPLALLAAGPTWRYAWLAFAATALLVTVYNARVLPRRATGRATARSAPPWDARRFARRDAAPLYATAFAYGLGGAVYWAFAGDTVTRATGNPEAAPAFWTLIGLAGISGVLTGALTERLGLRRSHALIVGALAASVALLGAAPGSWTAIGVSSVLYGSSFMAGSGLLAVWSYRVFPEAPSAGFSATVFFLGIGTVVGPTALGAVVDHQGLRAAFLLTALILTATAWARPSRTRGPRTVHDGAHAGR